MARNFCGRVHKAESKTGQKTTQTKWSVLFLHFELLSLYVCDGPKWPYQNRPLQHEPLHTNTHVYVRALAISKPNDTIDVSNKIAMVLPFVDPMIKIKQNWKKKEFTHKDSTLTPCVIHTNKNKRKKTTNIVSSVQVEKVNAYWKYTVGRNVGRYEHNACSSFHTTFRSLPLASTPLSSVRATFFYMWRNIHFVSKIDDGESRKNCSRCILY